MKTLFSKYTYTPESVYPRFKKIKLRNIEKIYNSSEKEINTQFLLLFDRCVEVIEV